MGNDTTILTFTGDLCCNNRFEDALLSKKEIISNDLKNTLSQSACIIYNFEGGAVYPGSVSKKTYTVRNHPLIIPYLKSYGNPVVNLANNHIMDYGESGLNETIHNLKLNETGYFGACLNAEEALKPYTIKTNFTNINIWGVTADSLMDVKKNRSGTVGIKSIKYIGKAIKKQGRKEINIICFHGGEEYTLFPMPYKRHVLQNIARKYSPDVIIAHHSHTFQGIEKINNTIIFYSLGNFLFDYDSHKLYNGTNIGMLVNLYICKDKIDYSLNGLLIDYNQPFIDLYDLNKFPDSKNILSLANYKKSCLQDAFRVVFNNKIQPGSKPSKSNSITISRKFSLRKIKILFGIISDRYVFSLYFSAIKYKLFRND